LIERVIEIVNTTKRFHSLVAVNNLTLTVNSGEVLGVLGPNGAGKTTLFKLIAGILKPDSGTIRPNGNSWPSIGYKPERLLFPNHLRVRKYLATVAAIGNIPRHNIQEAVFHSLESVGLQDVADKQIKECSKGMRQRMALAQAMIGKPTLLLLDEPSNGLDPEGQDDICRLIEKLKSDGQTVILASHQLQEVTRVCSRLIILNRGSIHYQNPIGVALSERPHAVIEVDRPIHPVRNIIESLHSEVEINERKVVLRNEAIAMRRQVLGILVSAGYDILRVQQSRVTLAEIYAEAVQ
jgi:ABC-2 type transport system ATP-binding protein